MSECSAQYICRPETVVPESSPVLPVDKISNFKYFLLEKFIIIVKL
jgi:hypothetical protein